MTRFSGTLGIISGTTSAMGGGRLMINHSIGRLLDELRARADHSRLCVPLLPEMQGNLNYAMDVAQQDVTFLPPMQTTMGAQKHYLHARRILRRFAESVDALFIRLPFQLPNAVQHLKRPKLLHVVSSPLEVVKASTDYSGVVRTLATTFAAHSEHAMADLAQEPRTRLCTNGAEMWHTLGGRHGRVVVSSCLYRDEMSNPRGPEVSDIPRLLFVGYLRPEKGVNDLLEAFDRLRQDRKVKLTLVGGSDRKTEAGRAITRRIETSLFADDIEQKGMMDFGLDLFDLYRSHDVLVQPSLSEGTPRTLVEARCFGCPVVATNVGGIPSSVEHNLDGLLVPPKSPGELAAAIARLLDDEPLRTRLVQNGLAARDRWSVESFADELIEELCIAAGQTP